MFLFLFQTPTVTEGQPLAVDLSEVDEPLKTIVIKFTPKPNTVAKVTVEKMEACLHRK